ncbi:MAG: exodeoxyribonuclease III [Myxococcales bacterium]|nr:exodeoxyribonuclease III [Myxococcales bacterium]HIK84916.1 exodeoxyribonuclease III [Myxococcales bacterium]
MPTKAKRAANSCRVYSWNVNGIRAATKKGLADWIRRSNAEIIGLQEVRAGLDVIPAEVLALDDYQHHYVAAERKGYSGVGLLSRRKPDRLDISLEEERFDSEGRLQIARFGRLIIANGYFPNGSGKDRSNDRVEYKLDWYRALFDRLQKWRRAGYRVLVMGDYNTAHKEIDLARPKDNRKTSGFLIKECEELDRWAEAGWIDTFREFESGPGHYSWWSQRFGVRAKNVGWRLDYVFASPSAMPFVRNAFIEPDVMGSDHCPVGVDLDPAIFD